MEIGKINFLNIRQFYNEVSIDDSLIYKVIRIVKSIILALYNLLVNIVSTFNNFSITKNPSKSFFQEHKSTIYKILKVTAVAGFCFYLGVYIKFGISKIFALKAERLKQEKIQSVMDNLEKVSLNAEIFLEKLFKYPQINIIPDDFQEVSSLVTKLETLKEKSEIDWSVKRLIKILITECNPEGILYKEFLFSHKNYEERICNIINNYKESVKLFDLLLITEFLHDLEIKKELIFDILEKRSNLHSNSDIRRYFRISNLDEKIQTDIAKYLIENDQDKDFFEKIIFAGIFENKYELFSLITNLHNNTSDVVSIKNEKDLANILILKSKTDMNFDSTFLYAIRVLEDELLQDKCLEAYIKKFASSLSYEKFTFNIEPFSQLALKINNTEIRNKIYRYLMDLLLTRNKSSQTQYLLN
jgi:hypothetical protein